MSHIHLTILISAHWSATSFSFLTDQVTLLCKIPLHTQLLYSLSIIQQQQQHLFNGPLSGTTRMSQYQNGETNLDLLEQVIVSDSRIRWAICKSALRPRQITMPVAHHWDFYRPDALPVAQPTAPKHWMQDSLSLIINAISLLVNNAWIYYIHFKYRPPQLHQHLHPHSTCHLIAKRIH